MTNMKSVEVFVFSSNTMTNIWAGYGAKAWAVADGSETYNKGRITKAKKMPIGSFGILYCIPSKSFTTPFVITTKPDDQKSIENIWPEKWVLPFSFEPLASPKSLLKGEKLYELLTGMRTRKIDNYSNYLKVQGNFAFQPSNISVDDWSAIIAALVH